MAVSSTVRFEVFMRDGFRCVYCGRDSQQSVLELDHIEPVSLGGSDDPWNLVAACTACNSAKSNKFWPLRHLPLPVKERLRFDYLLSGRREFVFGISPNFGAACPRCSSLYTELQESSYGDFHSVACVCSDCDAITTLCQAAQLRVSH